MAPTSTLRWRSGLFSFRARVATGKQPGRLTLSVPTCEPTEITLGGALSWNASYPDFRSDESWTLTYYLRGADDADIVPTTHVNADGSGGFEVRVTAAQLAALCATPGGYRLIGRVNKSGSEFDGTVVYNAHVLVLADPSTVVDAKSFNRQMLEALDAALLEGVADSGEFKAVSVNGRSVTYRDRAEMETARNHYALLVALETNPDGVVQHAGTFVYE